MIKFINKTTNTPMWVADERKQEYLRAGHKLAPIPCAKEPEKEAVEVVEDTKEAEKPKKKVSRKK
jgi:topoisomerase IA-like protein